MNKIPLVLLFNENYALAASVALLSLLDCKKPETEYEIFVMYENMSDDAMQKLNSITPINWIKIDYNPFGETLTTDRFPAICCSRLLIPMLFAEYDKVLYSDVDVMFKKDLTEVFNTDITNYYWAGVANGKNTQELKHGHPPCYEMGDTIFVDGFMVMNLKKMRQENFYKKCQDVVDRWKSSLISVGMDVLNMVCRDQICQLDYVYQIPGEIYHTDVNSPVYWQNESYQIPASKAQLQKDTVIIHYAGHSDPVKIWTKPEQDIPPEYMKYMRQSPFYKK